MRRRIVAPLFIALVATALLAGIAGGLLRAGIVWPSTWAVSSSAASAHAALMVCGFLGTVIGIERAVALRRRFAFAAPLASGIASLVMLAGHVTAAHSLYLVASLVFATASGVIVRRQPAPHTRLLLLAALAWVAGNVFVFVPNAAAATQPAWFAFLVLTIAAERLEMTRLMRRVPAASAALHTIVALLLLGAVLAWPMPGAGHAVYGLALAALPLWLLRFDIARRTLFTHGLSRYIAACLLGGHAWLLVAGIAWSAAALGAPTRDIALHALGLGFVVAMVMGHAPVILPAVARVKLAFGWPFYVPLVLLHASLLWRFAAGAFDPAARAAGAAGNAAAIGLFALTVLVAALSFRARAASAA